MNVKIKSEASPLLITRTIQQLLHQVSLQGQEAQYPLPVLGWFVVTF